MDCTIRVVKTKALISFAVTAKLICVFVFAYANCWFSHEAAQMVYPLEHRFYIVKLGYAGVCLFFSLIQNRLWDSFVERIHTIYVLCKKKNINFLLLKVFIFCNLKNLCILHWRVFLR